MTNKVIRVLAIIALIFLAFVVINIANKTITGNVVAGNRWCSGADVNHDGIVNKTDKDLVDATIIQSPDPLSPVSGCKEENSWCNLTDVNKDGYVNDTDSFLVGNSTTLEPICIGEHTCGTNDDCGTPSERKICDGSSLYTETKIPTCDNAATQESKCVDNFVPNSSINCTYGCINNACINLTLPNIDSGCTPSWNCGNWSACSNTTHTKTKICTDLNSCGTTTGRPATTQNCTTNTTNQSLTIPSLIICSKDIDCGSPKTTTVCQGNSSCINSTVYQCVSPGTKSSYCKTLSAINCDKNCPAGCSGAGVCNEELKSKTEIDLLEEIILGLNSKLPQPAIANKTAKSFVSCEGGDVNEDGVVNLTDFQIFKKEFQKNSTEINDTKSDINSDHLVDVEDFAFIKNNFGVTNCDIQKPFTYDLCIFALTSIGGIINFNDEQIISSCEKLVR